MTTNSLRDELRDLLAGTPGHYRLPSGLHGDVWIDLDPVFLRPDRTRRFAAALAGELATHAVDVVCGPLTGGAFLAQFVADELRAEFAFSDPSISPTLRPHLVGKRVAVVDDVIHAGSAARATVAGLTGCGAQLVAVGALLVLGDSAERLAAGWNVPLVSLDRRAADVWEPAECPLCASGIPLTGA